MSSSSATISSQSCSYTTARFTGSELGNVIVQGASIIKIQDQTLYFLLYFFYFFGVKIPFLVQPVAKLDEINMNAA